MPGAASGREMFRADMISDPVMLQTCHGRRPDTATSGKSAEAEKACRLT